MIRISDTVQAKLADLVVASILDGTLTDLAQRINALASKYSNTDLELSPDPYEGCIGFAIVTESGDVKLAGVLAKSPTTKQWGVHT